MNIPGILFTAPASGSGKTTVVCGILQALINRGYRPVSFKCGPDYIDPMFHSQVLGTPSVNLDSFFAGEDTLKYLYARHAAEGDFAVLEGVMGYYDGLGGTSTRASAYDIARITGLPSVLIVDCRGMSLSIGAVISGYVNFREDSHIRGVILNRLSPMLWGRMKSLLEAETGIPVLGYIPKDEQLTVASRHLGLVLPEEVEDLQAQVNRLALKMEETLDLDRLIEIADEAPPLERTPHPAKDLIERISGENSGRCVRIAAAKDEAFCFYYRDNLELLEDMGARIEYFSPLRDRKLPECDGLILPGGYPELHAEDLEKNDSMRASVREALKNGLPCMAECGGFMYLQQTIEDMDGHVRRMAGVLEGDCIRTRSLNGRFGYIELETSEDGLAGKDTGLIRGHEFHYYDSSHCGDAFTARKPLAGRSWPCMVMTDTMLAGYPHLYYYSNPKAAARFIGACRTFGERLRLSTEGADV